MGGGGGLQNFCYQIATFRVDMQHDHYQKRLTFILLTPSPGWGDASVGKIFATMLQHLWFLLI